MKYNSRASQLYREKLHQAAAQAMRLHGTKLHIDSGAADEETANGNNEKQKDFFASHEEFAPVTSAVTSDLIPTQQTTVAKNTAVNKADDTDAPNVDLAISAPDPAAAMSKPAAAPKRSTIGAKKPGTKKGMGMGGARKGLGAQKATKDFAEIEREAEMADQIYSTRMDAANNSQATDPVKSSEEEAKAMASMRLAYQDMSVQQKREEEKLKKSDPAKAAQMERLGMGFSGFGGGSKSHSLVSDMGEIVQEEPKGSKPSASRFGGTSKSSFFDDFEVVDVDKNDTPSWRTSRIDEICSTSNNQNSNTTSSAWENDLNENVSKSSNSLTSASNWDNTFEEKRKPISSGRMSSNANSSSSGNNSADAVNKFGNAKSISSDMYFGGQDNNDRDANLSRFQGSSSISSDMYFNREGAGGGGGLPRSASSYASYSNIQAPDMEDVRESVKQGVSKVAGRLSNMASGVMSQIQDRYGY